MTHLTDRLVAAAREIVRVPLRFPLPLLCAVLWTAFMIDGPTSILYTRGFHTQAVLYLPVALFATLAVKLAAESRGWRFWIWLPASALVLGLVALHPWVALGGSVSFATPQWWLLMPAVLLAAIAAPFLRPGVDDRAAWGFVATAVWRAGLALCVALVAALGLWGLQTGVETLFWEPEWPVTRFISSLIWSGSFGTGAAWMALAGIPREFDAAPEGDPPREARWLVAGLLVPLGVAYLALIYAFAGWTLIRLELPQGKVGWLIAGFAAFGVAIWMAAWPWRETGNRLAALWWRLFPPLLLVPVVMLAVAVGVRVEEYGLTEARYGLILLAVWLGGLAAYGSISRPPRLIGAPASLAVLLLLACFGPWGAGPVAIHSQLAELKHLIATRDTLPGSAELAKSPDRLDQVTDRIRDVARYLSNDRRVPAYKAWLAQHDLVEGKADNDLLAMLTREIEGKSALEKHFYLNTRYTGNDIDVRGFGSMYRLDQSSYNGTYVPQAFGYPDNAYTFSQERATLKVWRTDTPNRPVSFDLMKLNGGVKAGDKLADRRAMTLDAQNDVLRVRLVIKAINGTLYPYQSSRGPEVTWLSGYLLAGPPR